MVLFALVTSILLFLFMGERVLAELVSEVLAEQVILNTVVQCTIILKAPDVGITIVDTSDRKRTLAHENERHEDGKLAESTIPSLHNATKHAKRQRRRNLSGQMLACSKGRKTALELTSSPSQPIQSEKKKERN
uniref:Putative secreted protein n=1 Tax=Ixodes ricinus TaxID=34613 RepID=A0A6B0URP8_IXORI